MIQIQNELHGSTCCNTVKTGCQICGKNMENPNPNPIENGENFQMIKHGSNAVQGTGARPRSGQSTHAAWADTSHLSHQQLSPAGAPSPPAAAALPAAELPVVSPERDLAVVQGVAVAVASHHPQKSSAPPGQQAWLPSAWPHAVLAAALPSVGLWAPVASAASCLQAASASSSAGSSSPRSSCHG